MLDILPIGLQPVLVNFAFAGKTYLPRRHCVAASPTLPGRGPEPLTASPGKTLDTGMVGSSASAAAALSSADRARAGAVRYETLATPNRARNQPPLSLWLIPPELLQSQSFDTIIDTPRRIYTAR